MRLRRNKLRRTEAASEAQANWISKLEATISATVEAVANLVRTQALLMRGRPGEIAGGMNRAGSCLAGPYISLLFAMFTYSTILIVLNWWLDRIESPHYGSDFNINDFYLEPSWASNLGLILPMIIWVPIAGIVLSFVLASSDKDRQRTIRDMYVYSVGSFLCCLGFLITPILSSALIREWYLEWVVRTPAVFVGSFVLNDIERTCLAVGHVVIALRVAWVFESNVNSASPRGTLRRFAIYLVAAVAIPVSVFFSLKPIIRQYFYGTDHLEISGNARLVDVETIDLELVLTSERKKTVVIKSDDISLTLSDLEDKSSSRYPVFFYGPDDNWYTYLVLEPGRPTIVHATAGFRAGPGSQVWPLDKQMLAQMKADICVVNRRASASTYSCIGHQIQGP